jgi:hypothetical protein
MLMKAKSRILARYFAVIAVALLSMHLAEARKGVGMVWSTEKEYVAEGERM